MSSGFQESLFTPSVVNKWKPPTDWPRWWEAPSVTIDLETRDPDLEEKGAGWCHGKTRGEVVGIGVECEGDARYYPIAHHAGGNLPRDMVLRWVSKVAQSAGEKVFHHGVYDIGWLGNVGVHVKGSIFDTSYAAPLLDEHRFSYALDSLAMDYAGFGKSTDALEQAAARYGIHTTPAKNLIANLWQMHSSDVGPYGEGDVLATRALCEVQRPLLEAQGLMPVMRLECDLIQCMVDMRNQGVIIDQDAAAQLRLKLSQALVAGHRSQQQLWGRAINPKSGPEIAAQCKKLDVTYPCTSNGNPSFKKDWLATQTHPFLVQIFELRQIRSMQSLLESIVYQYLTPQGRIHCNFNQLRSDDGGTISGRFSSSLPNLQQIPMRHPVWGPLFRALFLPEHGARWYSADYSQQEYRLIVDYSLKMRLAGARQAAKAYAQDGADFHQIVADMMGRSDERDQMKNINFGIGYGMGVKLLAASLGVSFDEAKRLLAEYHEKAPFIGKLTEACSNRVAQRGYVRTLAGRRCRFPWWEPINSHRMDPRPVPIKSRDGAVTKWGQNVQRAYMHKSMNRVIQGGGADIFKRALLELYKAGLTPSLIVHDETDGSVTKRSQVKQIKEIMEHTTRTLPAMVVEAGVGKNWAEAH